MYPYIEIAIINAAMVVPLALFAEVAGRAFRRPALTHLLWVLILVKLVTPPVLQIPIVDRDWLKSTCSQLIPPVLSETSRVVVRTRIPQTVSDLPITSKPKTRPRTLANHDKRPVIRERSFSTELTQWLLSGAFRQLAFTALQMTWALGALVWFSVQGFRCIRFRWSLARGSAAPPELQNYSNRLAIQLGLTKSPTVWLMPDVMSPMLWGNGQSTLLIFPEQLLDRLDPDATGTLLTHELAHYRRKDHWVRMVALMATGFFWWHPVVWYARHQIEAVEEECCDALVLKAAAAPPKCYAEAILETVDFLAEYQLQLPPLATGLGQVPFLRQRLTWIMRGPRPQNLGFCGRVICLLIACTLPLQPTWLAAARPTPLAIPKIEIQKLPNNPTPPERDESNSEPAPSVVNFDSDRVPTSEVLAELPAPQSSSKVVSRWLGFEVRSHSFDGRFVVMGNKSSHYVLDLESGRDFDLSDFLITAMAFSRDADLFVTVGEDNVLRLWKAESFEVLEAWQIPGGGSKSVDVSTDGLSIVTGGRDGVTRVWNREVPQPVRELPREPAPVNCVRFSPDGELLAISTGDWRSPETGRIALFETESWNERISMNWNSPTAAVAFRADGESLTSGDWQGRIARWSIESGELLGLTHGHKDTMSAAEFSPNGSLLAEIQVPDLPPDTSWEEPRPREQYRWFFNNWQPASRLPSSPVSRNEATISLP